MYHMMNDFTIAFGEYDKSPGNYYLPENSPLKSAIYLALTLGKPLLITGDPGTGKTQLAYWAAWYLSNQVNNNLQSFVPAPFVFHTKTTSAGKDLFYHYDAIGHFQDKEGKKDVSQFISLSAMGQAIGQTLGKQALKEKYALNTIKNVDALQDAPASSVLLIDEIDKAPRDFTNDLLDEIENNRFYITEVDKTIYRSNDRRARILVILTSNSENTLPDAFLRRCLFYHVPFPSDAELLQIIINRISPFLSEVMQASNIDFMQRYKAALKLFRLIKERSVIKQPSTSELLDWIKVLHMEKLLDWPVDITNIAAMDEKQKASLMLSLYTLVKTRQDLEQIEGLLSNNQED